MMVDDIDFKQVMRNVRPLDKSILSTSTHTKAVNRRQLKQQITQRALNPQNASAAQHAPLPVEPHGKVNLLKDEHLYFLRHGYQDKVLRELKKGKRYPIYDTLDLHGLTRIKAIQQVNEQLASLPKNELISLLIIHGKGLHSNEGSPLKTTVSAHLKTVHSIKAYCSAQLRDGGTGALYVLVKV